MTENHTPYVAKPKPKNELLNGIGYYTYLIEYANNPNVKFKMNLESAETKVEVDFTTEILVRLIREEITGELGLYPFTPPTFNGLPYTILNGVINGEDVFGMINVGWAYTRHADPQRKVIYYGDLQSEFISYDTKIVIKEENKKRYLLKHWEFI